MEKFNIQITETSYGKITVEADSYEEALKIAEETYFKNPSDYVLESEETEFE